MNIVVLDGYTLNPGDLNWDDLERLGKCTIYDRTSPEQRLERAQDAEVLLTNKVVVDAELIEALPRLRFICVLSTGVNVVDLDAARARGIPVSNVPVYGTRSVAQMTMALILELTQHVGDLAASVRNGRWVGSFDWCYWDESPIELWGLELGIVGFGRIGRCVADLATAFGMEISAFDVAGSDFPPGVRAKGLDDLFESADIVTLHCPLTAETRGIVDERTIGLMKPTAFIVNAARGGLVQEHALAKALNEGRIAGAAMDVLSTEPPHVENPLLTAKNCIVTPHVAWATGAARNRLMAVVVANVEAFLKGTPQNVVN
jgi:glycerate dehydrogenase